MVDVIGVTLWGENVGALSWDNERNLGFFEYQPSFINKGLDVSPINMPFAGSKDKIYSFPTLDEQTYKGLPGMISDVLPDDFGNHLINRWLKLNGIVKSDFSPLDRLSYIGSRGMGALEFEPAKKLGYDQSTELNISSLVELSGKIQQKREDITLNLQETEAMNELIKVGTSAGGQRAKAIVAYNKDSKEVRSGQTKVPEGFEHFILKFDGVTNKELGDPQGYGKIEYAYYLMAIDCGIEMMPSQLLKENGRAHFMTKRFDRTGQGEKLHMQTLCALAHFDYRKPGVHGYEDALDIMRKLKLPKEQAVQLFRRMVFNVMARNQDDHTKNISFIMDKSGKWRLTPAYDVTYAYNPAGQWTNGHQMTIAGKRDNFTRKDLQSIADEINYTNANDDIEAIQVTLNQWEHYSDRAGIPKKQSQKLKKAFRLNFKV
ncbi:type II toxin-antitoxin system HipA family toxin [Flagellimonas halotolerans]|uniref:Type II toxin-antitoxin system HipA family toxin n=1 Tax=Flagellimonas halotolerans TaxID=3112164 RepID=A0ABU6IPH9_9FLAO|nr:MULTISPECIES: type II toxin-antitoxin system HipA family toxin [unclassified Allomuricauda]MEC3965135.1 type II toxin-antitoxin system HipA family toxin [Muricauda sp. SYSU M86414]MEC4265020.1 type II toxin-antitoxin system HipA family toxin [Muricauda sp. SYSU M84420]